MSGWGGRSGEGNEIRSDEGSDEGNRIRSDWGAGYRVMRGAR